MPLNDFGSSGLLAFWNSMTEDERKLLVERLETFHSLISSLKARGLIETDKNLTKIKILKKDKDCIDLKKLLKILKLPGIKIVD